MLTIVAGNSNSAQLIVWKEDEIPKLRMMYCKRSEEEEQRVNGVSRVILRQLSETHHRLLRDQALIDASLAIGSNGRSVHRPCLLPIGDPGDIAVLSAVSSIGVSLPAVLRAQEETSAERETQGERLRRTSEN